MVSGNMVTLGDQKIRWREGLNITAALSHLNNGHLYAVVKLDGKLVSRPNFDSTLVPQGARIEPVPMIAGG